ncbi:ankyrin repeat domain-containing protein [uncultured Campylobacter sp.]|uniref:ankyrin repeat domain-containing protein n=1 Tax=uncultured Campylobacter sp. TaxID=218934 RepID=UPI002611F981|nr:ankyrin repeat domain-containing protein [uncultured Campylobacter sp.]
MKSFKLRFIYAICVVVVCALYLLAERSGLVERKQTHFTVTSDTNVSKVPGLSKYVTQEEVDSFAFRYWDIDYNSNPKNVFKEPTIDVELKRLLKSKQTDKILKFMKDNNLSVDHTMHGGVTPVMYSSFWDDTNTTQELIKLGADIHKKDEYKLSAMAYAIENNATKAVRLLLDNGVKFEEVKMVQGYIVCPRYSDDTEIIVGNNIDIKLRTECLINHDHSKDPVYPLNYAIYSNLIEIADMMLQRGMKPKAYEGPLYYLSNSSIPFQRKEIFKRSIYTFLPRDMMYKDKLKLLIKHNIDGLPDKDDFIVARNNCLNNTAMSIKEKESYINHMNDYCYGEKILESYDWALRGRWEVKNNEEKDKGTDRYWKEKDFIKFFGYMPNDKKCTKLEPDIKILNFYNMKIDRYKALCGNGLSDEEILQKNSLKDKNSTEAFDIETFFKYLNFEEMLEEAKVKILHNGEKIDIKDYAEILRQEAAKKLDSNQ